MVNDSAAPHEGPQAQKQLPEWKLYLKQIPGLWAGREVPRGDLGREPPGDISDCDDKELLLVISLAQRQLDSLSTQLEDIRQRGQFLFTTLLVAIGFAFGVGSRVLDGSHPAVPVLLWFVSLLALVLALLGAAGIIVNRKVMGIVDSGWITRQSGPWLVASAKDHVESVGESWQTVATQLTMFRDAALLTIVGTLLACVSWFLTVW